MFEVRGSPIFASWLTDLVDYHASSYICILLYLLIKSSLLGYVYMSSILLDIHPYAQIAGIHHRTVKNQPDGTFSLMEVQVPVRTSFDHWPSLTLVCVENTHNILGGKALPLHWLDEVSVATFYSCHLKISQFPSSLNFPYFQGSTHSARSSGRHRLSCAIPHCQLYLTSHSHWSLRIRKNLHLAAHVRALSHSV